MEDGTPCEDGSFCTVTDACAAGRCLGQARDCASAGDNCNRGVCDEAGDQCTAAPKPNGTLCDDGQFCTVGDACGSGACVGNSRDCSAATDQCNTGTCNETMNACQAQPVTNGTSCDDAAFCTVGDACTAGNCSGAARDCSGATDQCNAGFCDETANTCTAQPAANGTVCDDGTYCTVADACTDGSCAGTARDCSALADQCNDGVCNETVGSCLAQPVVDGTTCEDGAFCSVDDVCTAGLCGGGERDCVSGGCNGVCDELANACECDPCIEGSPVSNAGVDQSAVPDETVQLDGSASSDPTGQPLGFNWYVSARPVGSTAPLSDASAANPTILADVSGEFVICLAVADADGCASTEDCMTLTVAPKVAFHVELIWDTDQTDIDVHYRAVGGDFFANCDVGEESDCYYWCMEPDWGIAGPDGATSNDPRLDVDNVVGFGPENINQDDLWDDGPFTIGVHHYADHGGGTATARIRVFVGGEVEYEASSPVLDCGDFWEVANVEVSGNSTAITVTPIDSTYYFEGVANNCPWTCDPSWYGDGTCDCGCRTSDSDCGADSCAGPGCCVAGCDYCW